MSADPAAAPSGVVTFLFIDVEGSTRRWEAEADCSGLIDLTKFYGVAIYMSTKTDLFGTPGHDARHPGVVILCAGVYFTVIAEDNHHALVNVGVGGRQRLRIISTRPQNQIPIFPDSEVC